MRNLQSYQTRSPYFFDAFFDDFATNLDRMFGGSNMDVARNAENGQFADSFFSPPYELSEDETHYWLSFDLPGVPKDSIHIEVKDQQLRVWGERKLESQDAKKTFSMRRYGRFERVFSLPTDVDANQIQAFYEDGVLKLMIARTGKTAGRSVKIEAGAGGRFGKLVGSSDENAAQTQTGSKKEAHVQ